MTDITEEDLEGKREQIARIIAPGLFAQSDELRRLGVGTAPFDTAALIVEPALAKADAILALVAPSLSSAREEVERLKKSEELYGFHARQRETRKQSDMATKALGYSGEGLDCCHAKWRFSDGPYPRAELETAVVDALTQEGVPAWFGDGVGIVAQMIEHQMNRAEKAEAEAAALREENERLRRALAPFQHGWWTHQNPDAEVWCHPAWSEADNRVICLVGDLHAARALADEIAARGGGT